MGWYTKKRWRVQFLGRYRLDGTSATKVKQQFKFKLPPIWKQNGAQTKNNLRKFSKQNQDRNFKSHNLQPLACPTTGGNSENKIKTETYKSHNLYPSFLPPTTTKYFPTHAVDLVIIDEAHHYSARTKKKISFVVFKTLKLLFLFSKGK